MSLIWIFIQVLIGYNLALPFLLYIGSSLFKNQANKKVRIGNDYPDYAIIVTAYEQTHMLPAVIESLLRINYNNYHIYVIADNCANYKLNISNPNVSLFKPNPILSSNTKSHFYAINRFIRKHDILTIIDSDNLVDSEYINELNKYFNRGFQAVQGIRRAKNLNTTIACLDSARDLYYNFYDGMVLFKLGSSSTLAGSGMAFKTELYKECLEHLEISGAGFDKVLQAEIVKRGHTIAYAPNAIVYDEKTSQAKQLINQRSRWINTWFKYVRSGIAIIFIGIKKWKFNQFLFGLILLRPPLFIFILLSILCFGANLLLNPFHNLYWILAFAMFVLGFFIALIRQNSSKLIYRSLGSIPKFVFLQTLSLYYSRTANKRSVATKHSELNSIQ